MLAPTHKRRAAVLAAITAALLAGTAYASMPSVQTMEPSRITLGESAQLTIAESGDDASPITPPMVPGLEFRAVDQSQRIESINGVSHSTNSVTYQVIPQHAGVFKIPDPQPGSMPLQLTVTDSGSGNANVGGSVSPAPAAGPSATVGSTPVTNDGSAFVRLRLPTHQLYVGERVPVDIQVGTRDGMVASLNGEPTLNGDAFTLEPLSDHPDRSAEIINGRPYTVFTWHSALEAVKPGDLSLTMATPLTVRIRHAQDNSFFAGSGFEDLFNDPTLSNFFGGETEKEITVASAPAAFTVLALPAAGRPADFSGAVGHFAVSSDVSDKRAVAGDPLTLSLHVSGTGSFDRVNAHMLKNSEYWTTYAPTATFKPADDAGYRGEKTFAQPVIARKSGSESLPALHFSWFDPQTRRYESAQTAPLPVSISPAPGGTPSLAQNSPAQITPTKPGGMTAATNAAVTPPMQGGLRPDHVVTGSGPASLVPLSQRPTFIAIPSLMMLAFSGAFFWVGRRRDNDGTEADPQAALQSYRLLFNEAAKSNDADLFFRTGRAAIQHAFGANWQVPPDEVTLDDVETRLGTQSTAAQVFRLADETAYSNQAPPVDLHRWQLLIEQQLKEAVS